MVIRRRGKKNHSGYVTGSHWRTYQAQLNRKTAGEGRIAVLAKCAVGLSVLLAMGYAAVMGTAGFACKDPRQDQPAAMENPAAESLLDKEKIRAVVAPSFFANLNERRFAFSSSGKTYTVETSIDPVLQNRLLKKVKRASSRCIAVVAMEPATGRILAMAGSSRMQPLKDPCIDSQFPAASIFKIITAAAAAEKFHFNANDIFEYNGRRHTLYKTQLKNRRNRYTNRITFRDSFAKSVNPVFGKLGAHYLGGAGLDRYARAFGFEGALNFELPLSASTISITDEPYQWAEVASGFNRQTTISPLHGALIASVIVNRGVLMEPTIVDRVIDEEGTVLYQGRENIVRRVISPGASRVVGTMMADTVRSGTSRKSFRGYRRDKVLSRLNIGGKTGSICNRSRDTRYDWFVGFAEEKKGSEKIVVSVVVGHGKYLGKRAGYFARLALSTYFKNYFAQTEASFSNL